MDQAIVGCPKAAKRIHKKQGSRLLRAWNTDHLEFKALIEECLDEGADGVISEALHQATPNQKADLEAEISLIAETVPLGDRVARLMIIPVMVNPAEGTRSDSAGISSAVLTDPAIALPAKSVFLRPCYYRLEEIAELSFSARRSLVTSIISASAETNLQMIQASDTFKGRGLYAAIVGAVPVESGAVVDILDEDIKFMDLTQFFAEILSTGHGIVDVSVPCSIGELGRKGELSSPWFVESTGFYDELQRFFDIGKEASHQQEIASSIRPMAAAFPHGYEIALVAEDGAIVDTLDILRDQIPVSYEDLIRAIKRMSSTCNILPGVVPKAMGAAIPRPPSGKPHLREVMGGRIQRELQDRENWFSGMRARMQELQAGSQ